MFTHSPSYKGQHGFTLLELSIVMIIVALVLGGVLQGRNLIEAAEVRAIYTDAQAHTTNISNFIDKYGSLPGDMYNAEGVWDVAAAGAACDTTDSGDRKTCNGDGDGRIALGTTDNGTNESVEHFRAWQHLNNAGLLSDFMSGVSGAGGVDHAVPDSNVPGGAMDGSGYTLYYVADGPAAPFFNVTGNEIYKHILHFGGQTAAGITDDMILLPQQAWEIDAKIDDTLPFSGNVRTYDNSVQANCVNAADATATYTVTYEDGRACNLIFLTGF